MEYRQTFQYSRWNCHRARWLIPYASTGGPGSAIIFVGLGLLGGEFLPVARSLDWAEVRLRELAQQSKDIWTRSSIPVKILISLIILGCVAAIGYGAYHLLFSGSK
jgi:hypothetical protein